jgi:hypothetical protein
LKLMNSNLLNRRVLRAFGAIAALGVSLLSSLAYAQSPSPFAVETNISGVYAYTQPPAGLNPLTASASELDLYGYPPRPAASESAEAFAKWATVVNPALKRVVPQLVQTNIYHRPASNLKLTQNSTRVTSKNWSGYALVHDAPAFTSVAGSWMVPAVQQAFGACTGGTDYSSQWVGIDGFNNSLLVQAGSDADAFCDNSTTTTYYHPWIEWLPASELEILQSSDAPFPFSPGDYVVVTVTATDWSGGVSTNGRLLFTDVTKGWQVSLTFTAASLGGTHVVGHSAEWIVERPGLGGTLTTLANYVTNPWLDTSATNINNRTLFPGSPGNATAYHLVMLDDNGNPISRVELLGTEALWFFAEGSAFSD